MNTLVGMHNKVVDNYNARHMGNIPAAHPIYGPSLNEVKQDIQKHADEFPTFAYSGSTNVFNQLGGVSLTQDYTSDSKHSGEVRTTTKPTGKGNKFGLTRSQWNVAPKLDYSASAAGPLMTIRLNDHATMDMTPAARKGTMVFDAILLGIDDIHQGGQELNANVLKAAMQDNALLSVQAKYADLYQRNLMAYPKSYVSIYNQFEGEKVSLVDLGEHYKQQVTQGRQVAFDSIQSVTQFVVPGETTLVKPEQGIKQFAELRQEVKTPTWQQRAMKETSVADLQADIQKAFMGNQQATVLAGLVTDLTPDTKVVIRDRNAENYAGDKSGDGYYDTTNDTVVLGSHLSPTAMNETLMHELVHAASYKALSSDSESPAVQIAVSALRQAYAAVMAHPEAGAKLREAMKPYAGQSSNVQAAEFLALALANRGLAQLVNKVQITADTGKELTSAVKRGRALISNLLAKLGEFFAAVLRLQTPKKVNQNSVFTGLIGVMDMLNAAGKPIQSTEDNQVLNHIREMDMATLVTKMDEGDTSSEHQKHLANWVGTVQRLLQQTYSKAVLDNTSTETDLTNQLNLEEHSPHIYEMAGLAFSDQERMSYELTRAALKAGFEHSMSVRHTAKTLYDTVKGAVHAQSFITPGITPDHPAFDYEAKRSQDIYAAIFQKTEASRETVKQMTYLPLLIKARRSESVLDFMALALTNEQVRNAVSRLQIKPEKVTILKGNPLDIATHAAQAGLRSINDTLLEQSGNIDHRIDQLGRTLVDLETRHKNRLLIQIGNGTLRSLTSLNHALSFTKTIVANAIKQTGLAEKAKAPVRVATWAALAALDKESSDKLMKTLHLIHDDFAEGKPGMIGNIINEAQGVTENNVNIARLLQVNNKLIDEESNAIRATTQNVLRQAFRRTLTTEENEGLYYMSKVDVATLLDEGHSLNDLRSYLSDNTAITHAVSRLHDLVQQVAGKSHLAYYQRMSENLGYLMATGVSPEAGTVMNTRFIAERLTPGMKPATVTEAKEVRPLIEQLASLWGIYYSNPKYKAAIANLINEESALPGRMNGVRVFLDTHNLVKRDVLQKQFNGEDSYFINKGYVRETTDPNKDMRIGTASDRATMAAEGYKPVYNMKSSGLIMYVSDQYYLPVYNQGALPTNSQRAKGTDLYAIHAAKGEMLSYGKVSDLVAGMNGELSGLNKPRVGRIDSEIVMNSPHHMVPLLNDVGEIVNYRYIMSDDVSRRVMNRATDGIMALANTAASNIMKTNSSKVAEMVVNELADMWNKDKFNDAGHRYLAISADMKDPLLKEAYRLLPATTKQLIKDKFGSDSLMIRRDLVNMVMGYRMPSMANAWANDGRMNKQLGWLVKNSFNAVFGAKGKLRAQQMESTIQAMMKEAKFTTVVKSGVVQGGNLVSNTWQLIMEGVNPDAAIKDQYLGMVGANKYIKNLARIRELDMLLKLDSHAGRVQEYRNEKLELEEELNADPIVKELIDEGMMTTFMEDLNAETISDQYSKKNIVLDKVNAWKDKQSKTVQAGLDFITAGRNTEYTQAMLHLTRYGDLGARYALYKHMLKANPEMSKQEILIHVGNAFVQYDLPADPTVHYLDSLGLLWFPRYYIRMQKQIFHLVQKNPALIMAEMFSEKLLADFDTPLDSSMLLKHPWNKLTMFGPIISAPGLLPAVNAVM